MSCERPMNSPRPVECLQIKDHSLVNQQQREDDEVSCLGLENDNFSQGSSCCDDWSWNEALADPCTQSQHHPMNHEIHHVSPTLSILSRKSQNTIRSLLQKSHTTLTTIDLSEEYGYESDTYHPPKKDRTQTSTASSREVPQVIHWKRQKKPRTRRPQTNKRSPQNPTVINEEDNMERVACSRTTKVKDEYGHSFGSVFQEMSEMVYSRRLPAQHHDENHHEESPTRRRLTENTTKDNLAERCMWWIRNDHSWWRHGDDLKEPGSLPPSFRHDRTRADSL